VDEAYNAFKRFTPGYLTGEDDDPKREMPPFLFANGYYGPDHKNNKFQMEYTWITGSVSWIYNVIMKEMIGIKPFFDGLIIDPKLPSEWKNIQVEREYQGKIFHIEIERTDVKQTEVICNGKRSNTNYIEWSKCESENTVQVYIP
jgi:cellobiose phosphorylase